MGQAYNQTDKRYAPAAPTGYQMVYFDPKSGQLVQSNPASTKKGMMGSGGKYDPKAPKWIPIGGAYGQTAYTPPSVDFNALPQQTIPQAQAYMRPNAPAQNIGSGYRPQFDPTFIQQMLAQRFGNQQPNAGIPAITRPAGPATLTPGAAQTYGGIQGQGGLAALRAIANPAPVTPTGGMPDAT